MPRSSVQQGVAPDRSRVTSSPAELDASSLLPEPFVRWFASRGWAPRLHQLELLAKARAGRCALLTAIMQRFERFSSLPTAVA